METVLDALKAMGKATAREISARMKIDVKEILEMLREHEELDQVALVNGWWQLTAVKKTQPKPKAAPIAPPVNKINESILAALLVEHGALTSEQLARLAGTTVRAVASALAMPVNKGRVVREKRGNAFHFALPVTAATLAAAKDAEVIQEAKPAAPAPVPAPQSAAAFLDTIPQMAKRPAAEMACPTPKAIASEIRRTKSRLNQLEELRVTVRTLTRQQRALGM